jgi:hypothetical protein
VFGLLTVAELLAIPAFWLLVTAVPGVLAIVVLPLVAAPVIRLLGVPMSRPLVIATAGLLVVAVLRSPSLAPLSRLDATIGPPTPTVFEPLAITLSRFLSAVGFRLLTVVVPRLLVVDVPLFPSLAPLSLLDAAITLLASAVLKLPVTALSRFLSAAGFWLLAAAVPGLLRGTGGSAFLHSRFLAKARSVALSPINGERPTQPGSPDPWLSWSYSS